MPRQLCEQQQALEGALRTPVFRQRQCKKRQLRLFWCIVRLVLAMPAERRDSISDLPNTRPSGHPLNDYAGPSSAAVSDLQSCKTPRGNTA